MIGVLKFLLGILLLPVVVAVTLAFKEELAQTRTLYDLFLLGVVSYTLWHLFVFTFNRVFEFSQKVFSELFRFSPTVQTLVPRIVPLGSVLLLLSFYIGQTLFNLKGLTYVVYFVAGFSLAVHVILTAAHLYQEDAHVLKSHYFLMICMTYFINLLIVGLLLDLNFSKFSFPELLQATGKHAVDIYKFLVSKYIY